MTPHRRHMDPSTLKMLLLRYNNFTLDAVKASFIAERETRKRAREEQLKAREEAVRMRTARLIPQSWLLKGCCERGGYAA